MQTHQTRERESQQQSQRHDTQRRDARRALQHRLAPSTYGVAPQIRAGLADNGVFDRVLGPVQAKGAAQGNDVHAIAAEGIRGPGSTLPHLAAIQKSFGKHDVSSVSAHVGGPAKAAAEGIGALAYASGNDVAFAQSPDLHTAAHEAAHIVQQRAGVSLKGGVGQAGDPYEQHADAVADLVASGKSAEPLLDQYAGASPGGATVQRQQGPDIIGDLADTLDRTDENVGPPMASPETRATLMSIAGLYMSLANDRFVEAADGVKEAIEVEHAAAESFLKLLLEVAIGGAVVGPAKAAVPVILAKSNYANPKSAQTRVNATIDFLSGKLIGEAQARVKVPAETRVDFITLLKEQARRAFAAIGSSFGERSSDQLAAIAALFSEDVTSKAFYTTRISQEVATYRAAVAPIGQGYYVGNLIGRQGVAAQIDGAPEGRLALCDRVDDARHFGRGTHVAFREWIPRSYTPMAYETAVARGALVHLPASIVDGYKAPED